MHTWSVWTRVNGKETPLGYEGGTAALIVKDLTEHQARSILEHLRIYANDYQVYIECE